MRDLNRKKIAKQEPTDTTINVNHFLGSIARIMKMVTITEVRRKPNFFMKTAMQQRLARR